MTNAPAEQDAERPRIHWEIPVFAFVVLGSLATAVYAVVETFWG